MADLRQRNRISDSEADRRISDLENSGEFDGMSDDFKQLGQNDDQDEDTPHIDWSKYDEDSNPVDDYYKQKYAKKTAENLSDAEKSAAGGGKKDDDVSGQEKSPDGPISGFGGKAKGKLRGAISGWKKGGPTGGIVGLILGLFFGSSVLFAPMSLLANFGSILSNHFDLGNHHFLATGKSFVAAYFKGQTRDCSTSKIKCKFTSISERQLKSWEARGIKVDVGDGTKNTLGRYKVRGLEFPNGRKVTSIFQYNALKYNDPYAHSLLKRFPVRAGWLSAKSSINKSLKKLGAKTTKFVSSKLSDKSERVAANNEAMNSHTGASVDANGNTDPRAIETKGKASEGDQIRAGDGKMKGLDGAARAGSIVGIAALPVELACITYTVIRAVQATSTFLWHEELVKFATPFFQASSQSKNGGVNGDLDAETAEYYADRLTQPVTQKEADADPDDNITQDMVGKTAMDSKGMQEALHGDSLNLQGENNYASTYTGWNPATQIWGSGVVADMRETLGPDNIRIACVTAHVVSYVGLAACVSPAIFGCLAKLAVQLGAVYLFGDDALKLVAEKLREPAMKAIADANLTSELHGPQLGEALVSAHGVMSSYGDRASGFPVAGETNTAYQAHLDMITDEDYIVDKIATAKYEASQNQLDATNQYSFAGIVASKIAKTPWDGSLTSVFKNIASAVSAIPSTSIAGAAKEGLYQPIQVYQSQEKFKKSIENCTDPALAEAEIPCTGQSGRSVPYLLKPATDCMKEELREGSDTICIEKAIDYLSKKTYKDGKTYIDADSGKPGDFSKYKAGSGEYDNPFLMYMAYCGADRKYPVGYTDEDVMSDNDDWHVGRACAASTSGKSKSEKISYNDLAWISYYYHMCIALYGSEENQDYCWDDAPAPSAPTPSTTPSTGTIAIDPGHSVPEISDPEPTTGATLSDYPNGAEVDDMWEAAQQVKSGLEAAGYTVKMLRNSKDEKVNFAERAERARGSAMVVSLHSNGGGDNWIAYQMVGGHRVGPSGTLTFENADTANKSKQCAEASAQEMGIGSQAGINFNGRSGIAPGDLPWVQLLSPDAPWIYHEVDPPDGGGGSSAMGADAIKKFADGVVAGLKKCNISPSAEAPADPAINASVPTANDLIIAQDAPIENPLVGTLFAGLPLGFHSYTSRSSVNNNVVLPEFNFASSYTRYWENIAGI